MLELVDQLCWARSISNRSWAQHIGFETESTFSDPCIILLLLTILAYSELTLSSLWHITDSILWTLSSSEQDKAFPCSEQDKVHVSWAYLRDFSIEYLLTYKKNVKKFWTNFINAPAGYRTPHCLGERRKHYPLDQLCLMKVMMLLGLYKSWCT